MHSRATANGTVIDATRLSEKGDDASGRFVDSRLVAREAGGTWLAQVLNGGLRFVAAFFAARTLGVDGYGTYTLALTITAIGSAVSTLGLSPGLLPFLSRARRSRDSQGVAALVRAALLLVGTASAAVSALVLVTAPWLGESVFGQTDLPGVLRALTPLIVLGAVVAVLGTCLQGFFAVKERAWIEHVLVMGLTATGLATTWWFGWGWNGVVGATLVGPVVGLVGAAIVLSRVSPGALRAPPHPWRRPAGDLLAYSWPLLGTSMLLFLLTWTDVLLMGVFRSAADVGVYGLCARLVVGVLLVHEGIGQVFLPRMSDLFVAGDRMGMQRLVHLTSRWAMWPALCLAAVLIVWGGHLLALFGSEFAVGAAPLAVLATAKAVAAGTGMSGRIFAVTGRARLNLINLVLMVSGNILLNVLWIPRHGALGAAGATLVSLAGTKVLQVVEVAWLYHLLPWDRRSLVPIVGIGSLALGSAALRDGFGGSWGWIVPLVTFVAACVGVFLLWGVGEEERDVWRAVRQRVRRGARV